MHTHTFTDERGGTRVGDAVDFEIPLDWLVGGFVRRDVEKIFAFRQQALAKWGLNYVIDEYLPRKLKETEKFLP